MAPIWHATVSGALAVGIGVTSGQWSAAGCIVLGGVFVDFDHVFDYLAVPDRRLSYRHFRDTFLHTRLRRTYLVFHSWELFCVLAAVAIPTGNVMLWGLVMGLAVHMLLDFCGNWTVKGFSLVFRAANHFQPAKIFRVVNPVEDPG